MVTQARVSSICNKLRKIFMVKNPGEHWKTNSTISTSNIYDFIFLTHRHYQCLCILHHALLIQISSQTLSCIHAQGWAFCNLLKRPNVCIFASWLCLIFGTNDWIVKLYGVNPNAQLSSHLHGSIITATTYMILREMRKEPRNNFTPLK